MKIAGEYSFNNGKQVVESKYATELAEIKKVIVKVNSSLLKTKSSKEKTMPGKMLYNPRALNLAFDEEFKPFGWVKRRVKCDYPTEFYIICNIPSCETLQKVLQ